MKKQLGILILLSAFTAQAAGVLEKHPTDSFQIGVSSSSSQKNFLFDLGLGASNPKLGVDTALQGLNFNKNVLSLGDGTTSQKSITANIGNGATNPKIAWSSANQDWEFSNDGTNFSSMGSGSGGSSGVNLLSNGDFESGISLGWTNTGGTFASVSSGANVLIGKKSATFTASASGQSVQSTLYSIPNGLTGKACAASFMYKGGDVGLTFRVLDNSANILASQVLQSASSAQTVSLPFLCPSSGSIQLQVVSSASASLVAMDQMFLGQNTLIATSQATLYGTLEISGSCGGNWTTSSPTFSNMGTNTGCTYTATGNASAPATQIQGIRFASLPPGEYVFEFNGAFYTTSNGGIAQFRLTDGTNVSPETPALYSNSNLAVPSLGLLHMSYTTAQSNITFELQGQVQVAGTSGANASGEIIKVWRYPTQSEIAVRPETINWFVDLFQMPTIGNNLGSTAQVSQISIEDPTLVSTSSGSIPAQVPCGTSASTGLTCSSGIAEVGVAASLPSSGIVEVCAQFTVAQTFLTTGSNAFDYFYMVETVDGSETPIQGKTDYQGLVENSIASNTGVEYTNGQTICQTFNVPNVGKHVYKLQYTSVMSNSPQTAIGPIEWRIRPLTQNVPAPVLVGSVTSPSSGVETIVRGSISPQCTSDPCAVADSNGAIVSVNRIGTGSYLVNFTPGTFNGSYTCTCTSTQGGGISGVNTCFVGNSTANQAFIWTSTAGTAQDTLFGFICLGQK